MLEHVEKNGTKTTLASVPDLICVLDSASGRNLGVPEYRYGLRVAILGMTCSPRLTETKPDMRITGPGAFGFDFDYRPVGEYVAPRSVIEEYAS